MTDHESDDPHSDDYCVVCWRSPTADGPMMHPVIGVENACVCDDCVEGTRVTLPFYQNWTEETAIGWASTETAPDEIPDEWTRDWVCAFLVLALNGEAGELAEKGKRVLRGDGNLDDLEGEMGDVFWYLVRLADELDLSLGGVLAENINKLEDRQNRGVIAGSGDDR